MSVPNLAVCETVSSIFFWLFTQPKESITYFIIPILFHKNEFSKKSGFTGSPICARILCQSYKLPLNKTARDDFS